MVSIVVWVLQINMATLIFLISLGVFVYYGYKLLIYIINKIK